ncbi:MAG: hypothetical protein ACP5HS_05325 [Anaerolineae bacterium]
MVKILKFGVVIGLLVALIGGVVYILASPSEAQAGLGERGGAIASATSDDGFAYGQGGLRGAGRYGDLTDACDGTGDCEMVAAELARGRVGGQSVSRGTGFDGAARWPEAALAARGSGYQGGGRLADSDVAPRGGYGSVPLAESPDWETLTGEVVESGNEIFVATANGETVMVGLGQAFYREEMGFVVSVGDQVSVEGYLEDGEFKAGTVENLTTGETIVLRDASGRPMWAGRGNRQNAP